MTQVNARIEHQSTAPPAALRTRTPMLLLLSALLALSFAPMTGSAQINTSNEVQVPLPTAFGQPGSVSISGAMGAVSDGIPIEAPPGRRGMKPRLSLSFSSLAGNGIAGLGWSLGTGSVEKWRGDGTPSVRATIDGTPSDRYSYAVGGAGGELHDENGDGVYRSRIESVYRPFQKDGDGWLMYDGQGVAYRFGSSAGSRIDGEVWMIDRVEDPSGNTILYTYDQECALVASGQTCDADSQALHLSAVHYTGFAPDNDLGPNLITFDYEPRPDRAVSYRRGAREARNLRLLQINVFAQGDLVRRYRLDYSQYAAGPSLLQQVTLVGSDGLSEVTLRTLEYGERQLGWPGALQTPDLPVDLADADGKSTGAQLMDVDGDGFSDVVDNGTNVYLGDGLGGFTLSTAWSASLVSADATIVADDGIDTGVRFLDVDGDARTDILIATPERTEVWLNTGAGWTLDSAWTANLASLSALNIALVDANASTACRAPLCSDFGTNPPAGCSAPYCTGDEETDPEDCLVLEEGETEAPFCEAPNYSDPGTEPFAVIGAAGESKGVEFADVNADGRADILWSLKFDQTTFLGETPRIVRAVFLNGGADNPGWHQSDSLSGALANVLTNEGGAAGAFVVEAAYQGYSLMDANGDGLADIVRSIEGKQAVYLGRGGSWVLDDSYTNSLVDQNLFALDADFSGQGLISIDFNDDGLVDYLRAKGGEAAQAYRNTGSGWTPDADMSALFASTGIAFVSSDDKSTGATLADIDGNGVIDLVSAPAGVQNQILLGDVFRSGKLEFATDALGQQTEITWIASTVFDHTTESGIHGLPVALTLVDTVTRSNSPGHTFLAQLDYEGGLYTANGFLGFRTVTQAPSAGLTTESHFYQDEDRSFQPFETRSFDSLGALKSFSETETIVRDAETGVKQVLLTTTQTQRYGANGALSTTSLVEREYDAFMQATSVFNDPQVEIAGDEHTASYEWAQDPAAGFWSGMTKATAHGPSGAFVSETQTVFDARGLPISTKEILGAGEFVETQIGYDAQGNVIVVTDRAGGVTSFEYDPTGTFRVQATDALGRIRRSDYDPRFGTLVSDVDPSGNETTTSYDAFGRKTRIVSPGDEASPFGTASYVYSEVGDPEQQHFKLLRTENAGTSDVFETITYFDAAGRVYRTEAEGPDGLPIVTEIAFGPDGQAIASSLPFFEGDVPEVIESERDDLGRLVALTDALGQRIEMHYDGFALEILDARGNLTDVLVNAAGNPSEIGLIVDGQLQTTQYSYDVSGRMTGVVDALGTVTAITYDALGRRNELQDPNAGTYTYAYDGEGRLTQQTAPDGGITTMTYSAAGDLLEKRLPDGTTQAFHYGTDAATNGVGQLVRVVDVAGMLEISYDARGRAIERRRTVDGRTYVTGVTYDSMDRIRQVIYPDGFVIQYAYDAGNNLAAITDAEGHPVAEDFQYNASQRITEFAFGNGVTADYDYDRMARVLSARTTTGAGVDLQHLLYEYDAANNVLSMEDLASGRNQAFDYDEANRLVGAVGPYGEETYQYDAVGSLLRKGDLLFAHDASSPQRMTCGAEVGANSSKKKPNASVQACAGALGIDPALVLRAFDIAHDNRGNIVSKGDVHYEYDGDNRLVAARDKRGRLIEQNRYDASGELIVKQDRNEKTVYIDGLYEEGKTHVSRHVYAGSLLVATIIMPKSQVVLIAEAHPTQHRALYAVGTSGAGFFLFLQWAYLRTGSRTRRAFAESLAACRARPGILAVIFLTAFSTWPQMGHANHLNTEDSERRFYYHANHLGSVNIVTDEAAEIVARRDYRPFGESFEWTGANSGPREVLQTFQGHRFNDDTGLYNMNARYYDAELGQFLSSDTVVTDTGDPRTLNRYAFAGGNPVQFVDPSGRGFWSSVGNFFTDVGDAFTDAADWISDHAVEILTVIVIIVVVVLIVAAVILTGGAAAILAGSIGVASISSFAALGAAVGFATFGGIALSQGNTIATAEFWIAAGTGTVLGALVGAAIPVAFFPATTIAGQIAAGALIGAATGGLEQAIGCATGCGGVENLFLPVAQGVLIGGILGGIGGGVAGKFFPRAGATKLARLGRFIVEPGKFGFIVKTTYSTYSSAGGPGLSGRRTATGDAFRLLKIGFGIGNEDIGDFRDADRTPFFFGTLDSAGTGLQTAPLSP